MSKQKELIEKALNYIELIEQSKRFQRADKTQLDWMLPNDFMDISNFRKNRIDIHNKMQNKMQNRVNNLLKQAVE